MTIPSDELPAVIRQAQQGESQAVSRLYEAYAPLIYRYIDYRVPTDAEDLVAEVFLKMVEGLSRYRYTGAPFEAWLYRIAAARVATYYRRGKRRETVELDERLANKTIGPEDSLVEQQELVQLQAAVRQLKADQQDVLLLRFVERKSHAEVAQILGKSETAVKSIQHRALTRLADLLGAETKMHHYLRGQA